MSNPDATRYVIRADLPVAEHLPPQIVYWRDGRGWAPRRLATVYTALDDVNTALDHGVPVADLRFCKVRTLKPKAAPSVEAPTTHAPLVPTLDLLAASVCSNVIRATGRVPPGLDVKVGDRVIVGKYGLTVTEINGDLAQCSSHPQETHGL